MASDGRLLPRRGRRMPKSAAPRGIDRTPAGNVRRAGNRPRVRLFGWESSAGEGRGRKKAADEPRPPLGARVYRPAASAAEPACIFLRRVPFLLHLVCPPASTLLFRLVCLSRTRRRRTAKRSSCWWGWTTTWQQL